MSDEPTLPVLPPEEPQHSALGEILGDRVGPYKLMQVIGEGGFGVVWLAERREPMVQRVALKIIKPGMDSKGVIARFEQERQALAVMDHPSVARVYDGGVTSPAMGSRPYFVMEHVPGEPITDFCDRHNYTLTQRLELFIPVCEAVQHAHHKGLIHRDLKPSNILVTIKDGHAIPKVIDFGVAKAMSHTLTEKTIFTEQGQLIGTPEYMSPEQAEMGALDVDTRTDVYSLGVVLYELLAGVLPFDSKALRAAGHDAVRRMIREQDAPRPSTRLSTVDVATSAGIARHRQQDLPHLARVLQRELDWIPLKALRKDRAERYATPTDLARDVQRYLSGEALEAGPESRSYRVRKYLRRHRGPIGALGAVIVALSVGLGLALWGARMATRAEGEQRRLAQAAVTASELARTQSDQTKLQQRVAQSEAQRAEQLNDFLRELFRWRTAGGVSAGSVTLMQTLNRAEGIVSDWVDSDPARAATTRLFLATAFMELSEAARARAQLDAADALLDSLAPPPRSLQARSSLLRAYIELNDGSAKTAAGHAARAVQMCLELPAPNCKTTVDAYSLLSIAHFESGQNKEAYESMINAFVVAHRMVGEEVTPAEIHRAMDTLAHEVTVLWNAGRRGEAEARLWEYAKPYVDALGPDRAVPEGIAAVAMYISEYEKDAKRAAPLYALAHIVSRRLLSDSSPTTAQLASLARWYSDDQATTTLTKLTLDRFTSVFGQAPDAEALDALNLLSVAMKEGRHQEALAHLDVAVHALAGNRPCEPCTLRLMGLRLRILASLGLSDQFQSAIDSGSASAQRFLSGATTAGELEAIIEFATDAHAAQANSVGADLLRRCALVLRSKAAPTGLPALYAQLPWRLSAALYTASMKDEALGLAAEFPEYFERPDSAGLAALEQDFVLSVGTHLENQNRFAEADGWLTTAVDSFAAEYRYKPISVWAVRTTQRLARHTDGALDEAMDVWSAYEAVYRREKGPTTIHVEPWMLALSKAALTESAARAIANAEATWTKVLAELQTASDLSEASSFNRQAWRVVCLANVPDGEPLTIAQALELATKATALAPREPDYVNTLGVAQYRAGRFDEAVTTLTRSCAASKAAGREEQPSDWAFLALANHAAGHSKEASVARSTFLELAQLAKWADNADVAAWKLEVSAALGN